MVKPLLQLYIKERVTASTDQAAPHAVSAWQFQVPGPNCENSEASSDFRPTNRKIMMVMAAF